MMIKSLLYALCCWFSLDKHDPVLCLIISDPVPLLILKAVVWNQPVFDLIAKFSAFQ